MILKKHKMLRMTGQAALLLVLFVLVGTVPIPAAQAAQECLSATGEAAVTACRRELLHDPGNRDTRFALADAFMSLKRYEDAVAILREGVEHFPGDERIKKKLLLAESYLEEQRWIEKQQQRTDAASSSKKQDTQVRLSIIRCKKLTGDAAMAACNQGLAMAPNNPELLTGRGDAWLEMGRIGNAILDYESALAADSRNRDAAKNLRLAHTKRKVKVAQCLQGEGADGLTACDAALMQGASDEFDIQKKRAGLLQGLGREAEALEAYRSAAHLNPADDQVTRTLAALSPREKKPTDRPTEKSLPADTQKTVVPAAKKKTLPENKPAIKPAAPVSPPVKAASVEPEVPPTAVPAKAAAPTTVKKAVQRPLQPPPAIQMAATQSRQFSNAPEVPGITH